MIVEEPAKARARILAAFVKANAARTAAASALGCDRRTFRAWVAKLKMEADLLAVEAIARRDGWFHGRHGGGNWHRNRRADEEETSDPF
jgi:hypothetical protein